MKTSRTEMKRAMETYINSMTPEELAKALEDAGLSFYKKIKASIFSHLPDYDQQELLWGGGDLRESMAIPLNNPRAADFPDVWSRNNQTYVDPADETKLTRTCNQLTDVVGKEDGPKYLLAA
jgi:hypothetical protein